MNIITMKGLCRAVQPKMACMRGLAFCGMPLVLLAVLLGGCGADTVDDPDEYMAWAGNPEHGLVQNSTEHASSARARYLSPEEQAYQEVDGDSSPEGNDGYNTAVKRYARTMTFVVSVPAPNPHGNGAPSDPNGGPADARLMVDANAGMQAVLRAAGREYRPLLMMPEMSGAMNAKQNFILVFGDEESPDRLLNASDYDLEFTDTQQARTDHFKFSRSNIDGRRRLVL